MFGRRSHQRFTVSLGSEGTLQILRDVIVEKHERERLIVISRQPGVSGEMLVLELTQLDSAFDVCVTESRPVMAEGAVRHRLILEFVHSDGVQLASAFPAHARDSAGMLASLMHRLPVRILNCSAGGCLLESRVAVDKATIASLRLVVHGQELVDDIQVVRSQAVQGSSSYQIGVEFLWIVPPTRQSLRRGISLDGALQPQGI